MITLDATLQTAQDGQTHNPIIELSGSAYLADIPFDGQTFNDLTTEETKPNLISMSSGRMAGTYLRAGALNLVITDTARTSWQEVAISNSVITACPVELINGTLGIVYAVGTAFRAVIVNPDTLAVGAVANLFTATVTDLHVMRDTDDVYWISYSDGGTSIHLSTSSNFTTWSSAGEVTIGSGRHSNPSIVQSTGSGELFLLLDHVDSTRTDGAELVNIYYVISDDMGSSWGSAVALTAYTQYGTTGYHPAGANRADDKLEIAWTEQSNVLTLDADMSGYIGDCDLYGTDFHYNPADNKLYIKSIFTGVGTKALCSVVILDVDTWTIDKCYSSTTIPAYNSVFAEQSTTWHRFIDTGAYVCAGVTAGGNYNVAMVIDVAADSIKTYQFLTDNNDYGLTKNVDTNFTGGGSTTLKAGYLDADSERLYLIFINEYVYTHKFYIGYIDITETADPITGKYTWNQIVESTLLDNYTLVGFNQMKVLPEAGYIMLSFHSAVSWWYGRLLLISLSSGGVVHDFYNPDTPGFHHNGVYYPCYYDGKIYGSFTYRSDYDMADKRGLMIIDLASGAITYQTPTYATKDNYGFDQMVPTGDGRIIIGTAGDGVVIYQISGGAWTQYTNANLPGLTPTGHDSLPSIDYDPATGTIFAGSFYYGVGWYGITAFPESGAFYQGKYKTGELSGTWSFGSTQDLTLNMSDRENAIAIDTNNGMWSLWQNVGTRNAIMWDSESGATSLAAYLVNGQALSITWSVSAPNKLTFTLSHGHLFDTTNQMSTLSGVLARGKLITVRIGEKIAGTNYWQNQGTFVVTETRISYAKGDYPTIQVTAEDISAIWEEGIIVASEAYDDANPAFVLDELVSDYGMLASAQFDIPTIADSHNLYHQFIDQSLSDCIQTILDHFGYFSHINVANQFEPRRINLSAASGHTYGDTDALLKYTPDNAFSSFTNRVTVTGEGRYYLEVLYDEETVATLAGVIGWWGENQVKRIYYDEDHEKTCRDPRLEIVQSVNDFWLFKYMGGGTEFMSDEDYYETWVEVTIEGPDLTGIVIAEIAAVLAIGAAAISCEYDCGIFMFALSVSISVLFYTLACFAAYSYNIWARAIGKEKQTIQASANDTELQQELNGQIVESTIDDALCYEVAHCQRVADYELSIVQAQRKRVQFDKIAHLQDEVGDVITIVHPYSGVSRNVFITDLTRAFTKPSSQQSTSGGVTDQISGWLVS